MTVIFDSNWPTLNVASVDVALEIGADVHAYDNGDITADEFRVKWGVHPDSDFNIAVVID